MHHKVKTSSFSSRPAFFWPAVTIIATLLLSACSRNQTTTGSTAGSTAAAPAVQASPVPATQAPALTSPTQPLATLSLPTQSATAQAVTTQALPATGATAPTCTSPATLTPAVTEGPFFKSGSPERTSLLESGMTGTKLILTGYVLTADCKPVSGALLDFWQADAQGNYDNSGYTLRGHQYTDSTGRYQLETIIPGLYPGRTEHIHVKVQAPGGPVLTTQLFFPGVATNQSDGIFSPQLLVNMSDSNNGKLATFNFIVATQ